MENAVSALKIAFAIFVFVLGLTILFGMAGQAREVSRVLIAEADKTTYYEYYRGDDPSIDDNGNRIVSFKEIIPALYRYSEENYAVTIIDASGNIIARFDLDTESICNNWKSTSPNIKYTKYKFVTELCNVFNEVNVFAHRIGANEITTNRFENCYDDTSVVRDSDNKITYAEINNTANNNMEDLFRQLYGQLNASNINLIRRDYYCYWIRYYGLDISKN